MEPQMSDPEIKHLITHSGAFHADEVCATVILSALYPDAEILRTRDEYMIEDLAPDSITYDVGGVFNHNDRRYDHHQIGSPFREKSGLSYSSFGLIWHYYGFRYLRQCLKMTPVEAAAVAQAFDETLVKDIDALDNGETKEGQEALMHYASLPAMIVDQRPAFDNHTYEIEEECFHTALELARSVINAMLRRINADQRARGIVLEALRDRKDPRYIELPYAMPYDTVIHERGAEDVLFAVCNDQGVWLLTTISKNLGQYGGRKDLPEKWAGHRGSDLVEKTGVKDAIFCHQQRFIASARSHEGIMKMLEQALAD
jgi:uncharacterized UPF0160 family protein